MTRNQLEKLLHTIMWSLNDAGFSMTAGAYQDAYCRASDPNWTDAMLAEYAGYVLPPGKRGKVHLVLLPPYEARAIAVLKTLLTRFPDL